MLGLLHQLTSSAMSHQTGSSGPGCVSDHAPSASQP